MALCFQPVRYAYKRGRGTFDPDSQFSVSTLAATRLRYYLASVSNVELGIIDSNRFDGRIDSVWRIEN